MGANEMEVYPGDRILIVGAHDPYHLPLDKYERDNLACLFAALHAGGYCGSGDWFGQILWKLCPSKPYGEPITPPDDARPNVSVEQELENLRHALGAKR